MKFVSILAAAFAALSVSGAPSAAAQTMPASVAAEGGPWREQGAGRLRFWGFHVYDAKLWVRGERYAPDRPFVLAVKYARGFTGESIAQMSADEMRRIGGATEAQLARWTETMRRLFPAEVRAGDELAAASLADRGVRLFMNGRVIGEVAEPEFARAFFGIWLDPRTRATDLRLALLGERREP
jgi:hypothetical protein